MWLSIDLESIKNFGTFVFAVLMIFGIKSGGPPFFHDELGPSSLLHVLDFQIWPDGPGFPSLARQVSNFRFFVIFSGFLFVFRI